MKIFSSLKTVTVTEFNMKIRVTVGFHFEEAIICSKVLTAHRKHTRLFPLTVLIESLLGLGSGF